MLPSVVNYAELLVFELLILMVLSHDFLALKADETIKGSSIVTLGSSSPINELEE